MPAHLTAFSQVVLLDPVQYPGAIKAFAREVCRNDLLNFGAYRPLHFHPLFPNHFNLDGRICSALCGRVLD